VNNKANITSYKVGHKHPPEVLEKLRRKCPGFKPSWGFKPGMVPHNTKPKTLAACAQCGAEMALPPWKVKRGQKFCSKDCAYQGREIKGAFETGHADLVPPESRGHSEETRKKISVVQREKRIRGEDHPNWRGGKRNERRKAMATFEYRDWRTAVFTRDNYTCQCCGQKGQYLEADHIKPWCAFPDLRYDINNGRTLCRPCHMKQDTYGGKALKYMKAA
jgi:5-methylcytosine-specific restriction endonuclease McrA